MPDTSRTFRLTPTGLKPVDNPSPATFTRLDATGIPTTNTVQPGKASLETTKSYTTTPSGKLVVDVDKLMKSPKVQNDLKVLQKKTKKKLKPLAEWNSEQSHTCQVDDQPKPNGLACPECEAELLDRSWATGQYSNFNGTFIGVFCSCGFTGDRRT